MEIPYTVSPRADTGVYNAKLGIWLFLASEVMLFGGLFSSYLFLRLGSDDGYWPHGLLNVPIGTLNTAILIASSITVVLSWASLKMRQYARYRTYLAATILLGLVFLVIKLGYEYPAKFDHFGIFIKKESLAQYEDYLGNDYLSSKKLAPRYEISGHLHAVEVIKDGKPEEVEVHSPFEYEKLKAGGAQIESFKIALDPTNAEPKDSAHDRPSFFYEGPTEKLATVQAKDVQWASAFLPKHSSFFAVYYLITGLHGLHIVGGLVVMTYFFFFGHKLYRRNPEQMANRIEVCGLYWHFVDLVWIFVFPIFYLL
jgi:cytochrome c oxidase subunit 3